MYPSGDQIEELIGSQSMARQCLVTAIMHQPVAESSVLPVNGPTEDAKCEDLEKFVVGDDPEKFF